MNDTYDIRKKYCPVRQRNVIIRVRHPGGTEECTEQILCGKCANVYLHSADRVSHSE